MRCKPSFITCLRLETPAHHRNWYPHYSKTVRFGQNTEPPTSQTLLLHHLNIVFCDLVCGEPCVRVAWPSYPITLADAHTLKAWVAPLAHLRPKILSPNLFLLCLRPSGETFSDSGHTDVSELAVDGELEPRGEEEEAAAAPPPFEPFSLTSCSSMSPAGRASPLTCSGEDQSYPRDEQPAGLSPKDSVNLSLERRDHCSVKTGGRRESAALAPSARGLIQDASPQSSRSDESAKGCERVPEVGGCMLSSNYDAPARLVEKLEPRRKYQYKAR